jgi:hypothetical protein
MLGSERGSAASDRAADWFDPRRHFPQDVRD